MVPSGLNATAFTQPVAPVSGAARTGRAGLLTFHSQTSPSLLLAASVVPSGLNATELTRSPGPVSRGPSGVGWWASATSQSRTVRSPLPAASVVPFGLNATELTGPVDTFSVTNGSGLRE